MIKVKIEIRTPMEVIKSDTMEFNEQEFEAFKKLLDDAQGGRSAFIFSRKNKMESFGAELMKNSRVSMEWTFTDNEE